jgi:hypothetical protein
VHYSFPENTLGILRVAAVPSVQGAQRPLAERGGSGYRDAMTINDQLQEWSGFYTAVAGVAGVLVGLLFVALALSPSIMKDTAPAGLRVWCSETFHSLVMMLTFSLLFLIPDPSGPGIGIPIVLVTLMGLWQMRADFRSLKSDPDPRWSRRHAGIRRFGYLLAAYCAAIVVGVSLCLNQRDFIDWMVLPIFLLLVNAAINCWNILKEIGNLPGSGS